MTHDRLAFVGDVHGEVGKLEELMSRLPRDLHRVIFLGDYINRGPASKEVLDILVALSSEPQYCFLAGNHEVALLRGLDTGDLGQFLSMGGATAIRSYIRDPSPPDVLSELRASIPDPHLQFLRSLEERYEDGEILATHDPGASHQGARFHVAGHMTVGAVPRISRCKALIDTGAGLVGGRLTALFWPSLTYIQASGG